MIEFELFETGTKYRWSPATGFTLIDGKRDKKFELDFSTEMVSGDFGDPIEKAETILRNAPGVIISKIDYDFGGVNIY